MRERERERERVTDRQRQTSGNVDWVAFILWKVWRSCCCMTRVSGHSVWLRSMVSCSLMAMGAALVSEGRKRKCIAVLREKGEEEPFLAFFFPFLAQRWRDRGGSAKGKRGGRGGGVKKAENSITINKRLSISVFSLKTQTKCTFFLQNATRKRNEMRKQ